MKSSDLCMSAVTLHHVARVKIRRGRRIQVLCLRERADSTR